MPQQKVRFSTLDRIMILTAIIAGVAFAGIGVTMAVSHASSFDVTIQFVVAFVFLFTALSRLWLVTHPE